MLVHCFIWLSARVLNSNLNLNSNSFELRGKRKEKRNRKRIPKPKPRNLAQRPTPPFSRTAHPNPTGPLFSPPSATAHNLTPSPRAAQLARPSSATQPRLLPQRAGPAPRAPHTSERALAPLTPASRPSTGPLPPASPRRSATDTLGPAVGFVSPAPRVRNRTP